jgi:hypothetical protein
MALFDNNHENYGWARLRTRPPDVLEEARRRDAEATRRSSNQRSMRGLVTAEQP